MSWRCRFCNSTIFTITKRVIEEKKAVVFNEDGEIEHVDYTSKSFKDCIICNCCHNYSNGTDIANIAEWVEK
ncbi:MAG: hypothetical protein ACRCZ0_05945 [Cetobacterium sp.]